MAGIKKTALVTGASGFSAGYTIQKLLDRGWQVIGTDMRNPINELNNVKFIRADLTDKASLKPVVADVDVVFHTAGIVDYSASLEKLRAVNVEGTKNLIEASINAGVKKMVQWSSLAVYGFADPKFYDLPITEDAELNQNCKVRYDVSKREAEDAVINYYKENGFPVTIMRSGSMYGPHSYYGIYTLLKYVKQHSLPGAPTNFHKGSVPLVHVKDVAGAACFLSDEKEFNGEIYNVCDDNNLDMVQTFKFIANLTNQKFKIIIPLLNVVKKTIKPILKLLGKFSHWEAQHLRKKVNGRPPIPRLETDTIIYIFGSYWFSNEKIKNAGYEFEYPDRRFGLLETIDWYDKNGWDEPFVGY